MTALGVRRDKATLSSGCKVPPATNERLLSRYANDRYGSIGDSRFPAKNSRSAQSASWYFISQH
jgi:hypothetical protein